MRAPYPSIDWSLSKQESAAFVYTTENLPDHEAKAVVCMLAPNEGNVRPHAVSRRWLAEPSEAQITDEIVREAMVRLSQDVMH
jgi:hypothetical protein